MLGLSDPFLSGLCALVLDLLLYLLWYLCANSKMRPSVACVVKLLTVMLGTQQEEDGSKELWVDECLPHLWMSYLLCEVCRYGVVTVYRKTGPWCYPSTHCFPCLPGSAPWCTKCTVLYWSVLSATLPSMHLNTLGFEFASPFPTFDRCIMPREPEINSDYFVGKSPHYFIFSAFCSLKKRNPSANGRK